MEVPEEHVGQVVDLLGQRKGQMVDMSSGGPGRWRVASTLQPAAPPGSLRNACLRVGRAGGGTGMRLGCPWAWDMAGWLSLGSRGSAREEGGLRCTVPVLLIGRLTCLATPWARWNWVPV